MEVQLSCVCGSLDVCAERGCERLRRLPNFVPARLDAQPVLLFRVVNRILYKTNTIYSHNSCK